MIVAIGQIVCFGLLLFAVYNPIAIAVMLFLASGFGFGFSTPIQVRILHGARAAPRLASTLVSTAYNIGIAAGAFLGASLLNAGLDYALLPGDGPRHQHARHPHRRHLAAARPYTAADTNRLTTPAPSPAPPSPCPRPCRNRCGRDSRP